MKIQLKLVLAFLIVTFSITAVGYILISQLTKIAQPLTSDIPKSIDDIATASELDGYAQFIRYYDEVLTQSARNYAFTQDKKWQERYMTIEPQLDKIIKSAANKGNEKDKEIFSQINDANLALVEMEYRALELVDNGKADEAIRILESTEYWDQKRIYEQGLRDYKAIRGFEYDQALQT
ncbi:MAG: MCP four helix bundle domain-containing protein, partial [Nitrosopumilaceae archaeon]